MARLEIAYLGPAGTYTHQVAEERYGPKAKLIACDSIFDVFARVREKPARKGIVPLENSSGGTVYETADILLDRSFPLYIEELFTIEVKLALLGREGEPIKVVYSHFVPFEHCAGWLRKHYPRAEKRKVASTSLAASEAAKTPQAAALASRRAAELYDLDVLTFPVEQDVRNETQFIAVSHSSRRRPHAVQTSLGVSLRNEPGSLCNFLLPFRDEGVNLTRIVSRPVPGQPQRYAFLVDIVGVPSQPTVRRAIKQAGEACAELRILGAYPTHRYGSF